MNSLGIGFAEHYTVGLIASDKEPKDSGTLLEC